MKYVEIYQLQPGQSCAYLSDYKRNLSIRVLVSALRKKYPERRYRTSERYDDLSGRIMIDSGWREDQAELKTRIYRDV